ncbi:MAG: hypothetical protein A2Y76_01365 [Planctomycetes bacterium RBG_13_60_9]|nr:MAG: hypothetical protein A2Y76_01365 [Planctomycetes bacterium RBG_13_60_9]
MASTYVLVTAARNEQAYIERTIQSVIQQTILPSRWVIVSDASTDRTDEIVRQYAAEHSFMEFVRLESGSRRNFACQVYGQDAGAERVQDLAYEFIGMLDADITIAPDYYEKVLEKFACNPKLGIGGGVLFDSRGGRWIRQKVNVSLNVSGPVQMFRRRCYEEIGGYIPLERGGQDAIAEVMARMHGWEVRSFNDLRVLHHKATGACCGSAVVRRFHFGIRDYSYGSHPLFEAAKCLGRAVTEQPYVLGSLFRLSGYFCALLSREPKRVPSDVIQYLRREQLQRLYGVLSRGN